MLVFLVQHDLFKALEGESKLDANSEEEQGTVVRKGS